MSNFFDMFSNSDFSVSHFPHHSRTVVIEKGEIKYSVLVRENVRKLEAYVEEMASGDNFSGTVNNEKSTRCGVFARDQ